MPKKKLKEVAKAVKEAYREDRLTYSPSPSMAIFLPGIKSKLRKYGADYCLAQGDEIRASEARYESSEDSELIYEWYERAAELGADEDAVIKRLERLNRLCDKYSTSKRVRELKEDRILPLLDGLKRYKKRKERKLS